MAFEQAFAAVKAALKNPKGKDIDGHLAVEIVINDADNAGIGYLEVDNHEVRMEPYDYWDHDARLIGAAADLVAVFSGKLPLDTALQQGKVFVQGERALELARLIRKPAGRKPAAKTADAPAKTPATRKKKTQE